MSDKPYLVRAWGGGQDVVAEKYPPDLTHDGTLHWWFPTEEASRVFCNSLRTYSVCIQDQGPIDDNTDEPVDTHKRLIALVTLKTPDGKEYKLEWDHGYGCQPSNARYLWEDGNYSCDCNRSMFLHEKYPEILETDRCSETIELVSLTFELRD